MEDIINDIGNVSAISTRLSF